MFRDRTDRWWTGHELVNGVFEGGGAKGVAYVGALREMGRRGCWFGAVAGASAGAITAALVAAGLRPDEIEERMEELLAELADVRPGDREAAPNDPAGAVSPASGRGADGLQGECEDVAGSPRRRRKGLLRRAFEVVRRLRSEGQALPRERLIAWLDNLLWRALGRAVDPVTFKELWEHSGIELFVVAADLSLRRPKVFSRQTTPECQVSDAVVASSSIPFVFGGGLLAHPEKEGIDKVLLRTISDGGVWTNFPLFVFEDAVFRRTESIVPERVSKPVVGFLLEEEDRNEGLRQLVDREVRFERSPGAGRWPLEHVLGSAPLEAPDAGWGRRFAIRFLRFTTGILFWYSGDSKLPEVHRRRWPNVANPVRQALLELGNAALGFAQGWGPAIVYAALFCMLQAGALLATGLLASRFDLMGSLFVLVVAAAIYLFFWLPLTATFFLIPFLASWVLLRPARELGYGVAATFVSSSGTPPWIAARDNVVALPIRSLCPRAPVRALSFDMSREQRDRLIEDAEMATSEFLDDQGWPSAR